MKFQEAFEQTWAKTPKNSLPKGDSNIPKMLAFFWSMMATVISNGNGKIVLDDTVYINSNSNIVSIPVQKSPDNSSEDEDTGKEKAALDKNSTSTGKGKGEKVKDGAAKKDKSKKDVPPSDPNPPVDDKSIGENGNEGTATN